MLYIEDKLERVYKEMHIPQDFGGDIDNDDFYNVEDMVYDLKRATGLDIDYEHGVSKAVLLIPGVDRVLKIPFNGYYEYHITNEDEYYENDDVEPIYEDRFFEFENAGNEYNTWDYCLTELEMYDVAKKAGFAEFFPKTEVYGICDGCPVYLQEKVIPYKSALVSQEEKKNYKAQTKDKSRVFNWVSTKWGMDVITTYGLDRANEFFDFIDNNGMASDLHNGNLGYTKDGKPVILDWAGFDD